MYYFDQLSLYLLLAITTVENLIKLTEDIENAFAHARPPNKAIHLVLD